MKKKSIHSVLKGKLKFNNSNNINNINNINDVTDTSNITTTLTNKSHRNSVENKLINRSSSQRISLFKYPHVEVEANSSESRIPPRFSNKQNKSKLLARGSIEIYEIRTISSRSFFLSVGRHGEWIHPMLPKLRIRRIIDPNEFYLFISFSNPDRVWKIKFIEYDEIKINNEIIKDLETVITGICQYSCVKSLDLSSVEIYETNNQVIKGQSAQHNSEETDEKEDEENLDELNYLLETETDNNISNGNINKIEEEEKIWCSDETINIEINTSINDAFRRAMNNVIPPWDHNPDTSYNELIYAATTTSSTNNDCLHIPKRKNNSTSRRRISLYIPSSSNNNSINDKNFDNYSSITFLDQKNLSRRSISILSDYETLISLHDLKL